MAQAKPAPIKVQVRELIPQPEKSGNPSLADPSDPNYDGKFLRKSIMRKTVDYNSSVIRTLEVRSQMQIMSKNLWNKI